MRYPGDAVISIETEAKALLKNELSVHSPLPRPASLWDQDKITMKVVMANDCGLDKEKTELIEKKSDCLTKNPGTDLKALFLGRR